MRTYKELIDERNEVQIEITGLIEQYRTINKDSVESIAIETAVAFLRIRFSKVQKELLLYLNI